MFTVHCSTAELPRKGAGNITRHWGYGKSRNGYKNRRRPGGDGRGGGSWHGLGVLGRFRGYGGSLIGRSAVAGAAVTRACDALGLITIHGSRGTSVPRMPTEAALTALLRLEVELFSRLRGHVYDAVSSRHLIRPHTLPRHESTLVDLCE